MAKEVKAIKCPQCGSTSKTEIKPDVYRCANCQSEYFLDNDDVTVNYNHNYNYRYDNNLNQPISRQRIKLILTVAAIVFAILFVTILVSALFPKDNVNTVYPVSKVEEKEEPQEEYDFSVYKTYLFAQPDEEKPITIKLESRRYNADKDKSKNGYYLGFYDVISNTRFAEEKVLEPSASSSTIKMRQFSDGNKYLIIDGELFVADLSKGTINAVSKTFFSGYKELQVGLATVDFVFDDFGDGLTIMTNDGRKFYLYPLVKKLYTEDEFYKARSGFKTLLPGAKEVVMYLFTSKSSSYPEEKQQLLKVRYQDNGGGPKDLLNNVSWGKDYGRSGIFTDRDPYTKTLLSPYNMQRGRVLSFKDITPGRYYFSPYVLLGSGKNLLIQFKADANPKSGYRIQQINTETGEPMWTKPVKDTIREWIAYESGYVAVTRTDSLMVMDLKGNVLR